MPPKLQVCKLDFYGTATHDTPFHEQWYRRNGDPEVCGHPELPLSFGPSMTCAKCSLHYNNGWKVTFVTIGSMEIAFACQIQSITNEPSNIFQIF